MRITATLTLLLLLCLGASAQKPSIAQLKSWKPRNIGPAGMSGRITSIDVVHNQPDTWYVGAASGGVWKTENAGAAWTPIFDEQPTLNIGSLAIQQSNPNIIWVGTGEGNPRNSLNIGEGIYKSLDGGKTWKRMGLEKTRNIHRIVIDPANPQTVYAAAIGNPYAEHAERGVYKSTDGGETWNRILYVNDTAGAAELVMDPSNPNKLIASMWQHRRTPYSFKSGGKGSGLYITIDGGRNWKKLEPKDGLPAGELGRIGVAFARSMPSRVYAKVEAAKNGLYASNDGGFTWTLVNNKPDEVTDRPFYYQEIYVDPANENRIYDIHSTVTYSEDGGRNFKTMLPYSGIHPDHHAWWIHPTNPNFIIEGNDGGIGISRDRGQTWVFDEKLPVGQFYHINVDDQVPYNVMGGMQDNGSWHGPAYSWMNGGIRNYYWQNVGGGDGFDVVPDPQDPSWVYSMSQMGYLGRYNYQTGERWNIKPPALDTATQLRFNWNSAIAVDPLQKGTVYFASQFLYKSTNKGASWEIISPDLTTNNPEQQKQEENGGLTLDVTGAENFNTILTIAPSYKEQGVIWVGTDDGNVQLTRDGGKTWTNFRGKIPGMPTGAWIPQIRASRHNAGEALVVVNDYRRGDFKPYVFRTTDYGRTWSRVVNEQKVAGYALTVLQDPEEPNLMFLGTENGLWVSLDNGATFEQWKHGYPSVSTYDLAIQEREADLAIATFGRSLWVLDDIRPLRRMAAANNIAGRRLTVFPAPDAYLASYRAAPGYEWSTYGLYDADNRQRGAAISFLVQSPVAAKQPAAAKTSAKGAVVRNASAAKPVLEKPVQGEDSILFAGQRAAGARMDSAAAKTVADSVQVRIYNDRNEIIRNLKWKADTGFNRGWWGMEERGIRNPNAPKPRPNAPEPGGLSVLPGTYKVVLQMGAERDSTMITIKDDPRISRDGAVLQAQRREVERLRKSTERLATAMDGLRDWEEVLTKMQAQLRGLEGKDADSVRKLTTRLQDSLKNIREFVNGRTTDKQGIFRPQQVTVMNSLQTAQQYILGKSVAPAEQEAVLVRNAEAMVGTAVARINRFYESAWKPYRQLVEGTKLGLFKEYTPVQ
ncbi:VPS10 domain-containing protein [Pseudocnuella soli]|uniref:VPS10 domain-containing protein n=1 Tax=Pseudocnuella soli TaxID=2502779 RepID=UPI00104BBBEC|nr:hypothetical protein [Pseudocnuella soli]